MNTKGLVWIIVALTVAVCVLSFTTIASSWATYRNHRAGCSSRNALIDANKDMVRIAFTPPKGTILTSKQALQIADTEARIFARLDQARC